MKFEIVILHKQYYIMYKNLNLNLKNTKILICDREATKYSNI